MARFCRVSWSCLWWCGLLCILSIDAYAARKNVSVPSAYGLAKSSTEASRVGGSLRINGPLQGEFIPHSPTTSLSLKVKPSADYSIGRIINQAKPLVRGGFAGALFGAGFMWAMEQLPGATYDPATGQLLRKQTGESPGSYTYYQWEGHPAFYGTDPVSACRPADYSQEYLGQHYCTNGAKLIELTINCPNGVTRTSNGPACVADSVGTPFTDIDYDQLFASMTSHPDPNWIRDVLLKSCQNASNPETCADSLQEFKNNLIGPSTVNAGTTTTTSTYVKPDGTVGTKSSTTNTTYNIKYGPTSFTFNKTQTTQHTVDGEPAGEDTVVDDEDDAVEEDQTPDENDKDDEQPSPCASNCDGPAYEDMYEPTDKTKEDELDDFSSRVSNIPILSALGNYFSVSLPSTSCPVWSYNGSLGLWDVSMPINLNFDYHCIDWFVSLQPYIQIIVVFVFTILAIRVGLE